MGGPSRFPQERLGGGCGGVVFLPAGFGLFVLGFVGVCRGFFLVSRRRFRAGRFRGRALRSLSGRALGRVRPGSVLAPFAFVAVRVRRGGPLFLARRRGRVRPFVGSSPAAAPRLLRRAPGCRRGARVLVRVRAGLSLPAPVPFRSGRPGGRSRRLRRAVRPSRLGGRSFPVRGRSPAAFPLEVCRVSSRSRCLRRSRGVRVRFPPRRGFGLARWHRRVLSVRGSGSLRPHRE
jgi:hypothetical protein